MSKSIGGKYAVKNYLTIAAFGLVLLFTSNQAIVLLIAPYPPFGLVTVSFVGLSSYLILVGIYSSAISVSLDIGLRKSIRKSIEEHSGFLHGIGRAQMDKDVQEVVLKVSKDFSDKMVEQVGVEPSVTQEELKRYVSEVIDEIKSGGNRNLS